ncbi:MAG TPA: hypothetical protein VKT81_01895 [Bryobacteraceae bacterium]|nr:hypothetical protein [Bryobacteraceae bacterium]
MPFDSKAYGEQVGEILKLHQDGQRLIPLTSEACASDEARSQLKKQKSTKLFAGARAPEEALGGLFLYFSCADECHEIVQNLDSRDAAFWHAILHRQEPDARNSAYWFRQTGAHPVFAELGKAADEIAEKYPAAKFRSGRWDPQFFIDFCEEARRAPGSAKEAAALEIQRAEWQLLFDSCARPRT